MRRLVQPGEARSVTWRVLADGKALPGITDVRVTSSAHFQPDLFDFSVAVNAIGGRPWDWWGDKARHDTEMDVRVTINGAEQSLIVGTPDRIEMEPEEGSVTVEGRDLSSKLIDKQIQSLYQNKTSSEIASELAEEVGLQAVVTATTLPVSRYYGGSHSRGQRSRHSHHGTAWDLLSSLAEIEGYGLYVTGHDLHFEPEKDPNDTEPFLVKWDADQNRSDVCRLRVTSDLHVSADKIVVTVKVWSSAQGRAFTKTSPSGADPKAKGNTVKSYTRANLTEEQAQQLADARYAEIVKNGCAISFTCPGETTLTARDFLALSGFGQLNQTYFPDTVERTLTLRGYEQRVSAKNKHKQTEK